MKNSAVSAKSAKPDLDLRVDRALELPMYLQICQRFKTAIEQGHLHAGDRVPAVRALATELNLARGTRRDLFAGTGIHHYRFAHHAGTDLEQLVHGWR